MMGHRTRLKTGEEYDALGSRFWRHALCFLSRPGAVKRIKQQHNRRERHRMKQELQAEVNSCRMKSQHTRNEK